MLTIGQGLVAQYGTPGVPRPGVDVLWTGWSLPLLPLALILLAAGLYIQGVRIDRRRNGANALSSRRTAAFMSGLGVIYLATGSPVEAYDTTLFGVHMVQHILLFAIAAPLVMAGTPVTLAIRASSSGFRRSVLLPVLRSKPVEVITFPVVTWGLFAGVLWITHITPIFDATLSNVWLHELEHAIYLIAACLFWWPVIGRDPSRWKLTYPAKLLYLFLGMPVMTFLGLYLINAEQVVYPTYATVARTWGPDPLTDQELAGFIMWAIGGLIFLGWVLAIATMWLAAEERRGELLNERLDAEAERVGPQGLTGVGDPGRDETYVLSDPAASVPRGVGDEGGGG